MSSRREFMWGAMAAATAAPTMLWRQPAMAMSRSVDAVLFDERYPDSRAFALELARRGVPGLAVQYDIGRLWYGPLARLFEGRRVRLAGMTLHSDLFISTEFARDYRASLLYQGVHDCRGCTTLTHTLESDSLPMDPDVFSRRSAPRWSTELAQRLAEPPALAPFRTYGRLVARTPRTPDHPGVLYSWVLG